MADIPGCGLECSDLQPANPPDFVAEPPNFLPNVTDPAIRRWALDVHSLWNLLTRQVYLNVHSARTKVNETGSHDRWERRIASYGMDLHWKQGGREKGKLRGEEKETAACDEDWQGKLRERKAAVGGGKRLLNVASTATCGMEGEAEGEKQRERKATVGNWKRLLHVARAAACGKD